MADQIITVPSKPGRTLPTILLLAEDGETAVDEALTAVAATPGSNNPSQYSATFTDVPAGRYQWLIIEGGVVKGGGGITLKAADGRYIAYEYQEAVSVNKAFDMAITGGQSAPVTFSEPA